MFEWIDKDLKKYMDAVPAGLGVPLIKVRPCPTPMRALCLHVGRAVSAS